MNKIDRHKILIRHLISAGIATSQKELGRILGYKNESSFSQVINEKVDMPKDFINKLHSILPELNANWLIIGEGEMLKSSSSTQENNTIEDKNFLLVPLYNLDAVGGLNTCTEISDCPEYIDRYIPFIDARPGDICMPVTGNSMVPLYSPGCIVLLREVEGWREYFGFGNVFVLLLNDGRRIIKEVQKGIDEPKDSILCVSYNERNPPEELPKSLILRVYKVIRSLTNEGF